eukprot:844074-Prorocentrum_minimum.AAC.2
MKLRGIIRTLGIGYGNTHQWLRKILCCCYVQEKYELVIDDCTACLEINPNYTKVPSSYMGCCVFIIEITRIYPVASLRNVIPYWLIAFSSHYNSVLTPLPPTTERALLRRAQAYEKTDNFESANEGKPCLTSVGCNADLKKVVELEPNNLDASKEYARLGYKYSCVTVAAADTPGGRAAREAEGGDAW